jgi:transposase
LEAVRLAGQGEESVSATARRLGIHPTTLRLWIKQLSVDGAQAFPGNGRLKPDDEEIRKLRLELKRVTEERDILAKVTLFFGQQGHRK